MSIKANWTKDDWLAYKAWAKAWAEFVLAWAVVQATVALMCERED